MQCIEQIRVESEALSEFAKVMRPGVPTPSTVPQRTHGRAGRISLDEDSPKNGIGQLVLTLVKLLHEILERQAIRRIEAGTLTEIEIERLGMAMMKQAQEIERLRKEFGLEEDDLNLDLGPFGRLL